MPDWEWNWIDPDIVPNELPKLYSSGEESESGSGAVGGEGEAVASA